MFEQVRLNGDGATITFGFPYENYGKDKEWISLNISITIGNFTGTIFPAFHLTDLELFESAIKTALSGAQAKFANMEEDIRLEFIASARGSIQTIGSITYLSNAQATFSFSFTTDYEALKTLLGSISRYCEGLLKVN
jgi:hypothetical protein